jgi:hypothetical protein
MSPESEWGPYIDTTSRLAFWTLAPEGGTLFDIPRLFRDPEFRRSFYPALRTRNPGALQSLREFDELAGKKRFSRDQEDRSGPLIRRIERLTVNPTLARLFGQVQLAFDLEQIMADGKILLVRLNEADLGPGARQLVSNLLMGKLFEVTKGRRKDSPPFVVIVDEINSVIHAGWQGLIEQARKYNVVLVLAHQGMAQLKDPDVRNSLLVLFNRVCFQVTGPDQKHVASSFPRELADQIPGLSRYEAVVRLDDDLGNSHSFYRMEVAPPSRGDSAQLAEIRARSALLGRDREEVDRELRARSGIDESEEEQWT